MPLTDAQRATIRMRLGWADRFEQVDTRLEQAMSSIDSRPDTQILIETELTRLEALDAKMDAAATYFPASAVGSIRVEGAQNLALLRSQYRQAVGRVASLLGAEVRRDSSGGDLPTEFASWDGYFPQG